MQFYNIKADERVKGCPFRLSYSKKNKKQIRAPASSYLCNGILDVWNKCFEAVDFPHKNELKKDLKKLLKINKENDIVLPKDGKCKERIADEIVVKHFLRNINNWVGWNRKEKHFDIEVNEKEGYFTLDTWVEYQRWRFKKYFIDGTTILLDSILDPLEAFKQSKVELEDVFKCTENDDDDDD